MGEELKPLKMAEFPTWIRSYCIALCITHRPLPTYQMSLKSNKLLVDVRTGGRTFETHFIRSTRRSQPINTQKRKKNRRQKKALKNKMHSTSYGAVLQINLASRHILGK